MAKEIYINVSITEFGSGNIDCFLTQQVDDEEMEMERIDLDRARKLMWELKLAGGTKTVHVNSLDRHIVSRDVYIFLPN